MLNSKCTAALVVLAIVLTPDEFLHERSPSEVFKNNALKVVFLAS